MYHKDAFTLAMVPMFGSLWYWCKGHADVGQRLHREGDAVLGDGVNDSNLMRLDVLFGWAATYP